MTPDQWEQLADVFERGLGKPREERAAILSELRDPEMVRQVEELWANAEPPPSFLRGPALSGPLPMNAVDRPRLLRPGDSVDGRFTVVGPVGAGGMGEVYRARDERLQRIVALKVLPEGRAADARNRKRFEQEARSVSSLSHPRICALHDFGADGDCLYLVMEYVRGETLEARLRRGGPLSEAEAVAIALQICEGLRHAHQNRIVHRDLKPGNLMLGPDGVKILDFGIATRAAPSASGAVRAGHSGDGGEGVAEGGLTVADQILGSISYMSPEQALGQAVNGRSDIFALGAVISEMVTGQRAFPRGAEAGLSELGKDAPGPSRALAEIIEVSAEGPGTAVRLSGRTGTGAQRVEADCHTHSAESRPAAAACRSRRGRLFASFGAGPATDWRTRLWRATPHIANGSSRYGISSDDFARWKICCVLVGGRSRRQLRCLRAGDWLGSPAAAHDRPGFGEVAAMVSGWARDRLRSR